MITSVLQIEQEGQKTVIGSLVTQRPIQGSRVNESGIVELSLEKDSAEPGFMTWLLSARFWVEGCPRHLQVWEVKDMSQRGTLAVLSRVILKPEGMCIACAGTGTLQGTRHKATAKCPSCKGKGFVTGIWPEENANGSEKRGDTGVVGEGQVAVPAPEGQAGVGPAGDGGEKDPSGAAQG